MTDHLSDEGSPAATSAEDLVPTLTEGLIQVVVLRELDRAIARYPEWAHPFAGLEISRRMRRSFGQAHADGRLRISAQFLGTPALADLEDTVRHEFAHLVVGVREKHGPAWRRVARDLGAIPRATGRSRCDHLQGRMADGPFTLVAVMQSGEERVLRRVFRRSPRYRNYRFDRGGQRYRIGNEWVERFRYIDHRRATAGV